MNLCLRSIGITVAFFGVAFVQPATVVVTVDAPAGPPRPPALKSPLCGNLSAAAIVLTNNALKRP